MVKNIKLIAVVFLLIVSFFILLKGLNKTNNYSPILNSSKIDFNFKGRINEIPKKLNAWFNFENSIISENSQLIFGHWAAIKGKTKKKDIFGLDTGCVWGDKLTIMRLEDNKRFQINRIKK